MQQPLIRRKDRKGNGLILFTHVNIRNSKMSGASTILSGSNAVIRLNYRNVLNRELRRVHVAIGINDYKGQRIAHISNETTAQVFDKVPAENEVFEIFVKHLPLVPGRYSFTLFAKIDGEIADWIQDASYFDVGPGDFYATGKLPPDYQGYFFMDYQFMTEPAFSM